MFKYLSTAICVAAVVVCGCRKIDPPTPDCTDYLDSSKVNQVQTLGSHNSYRMRTYGPLYQFVYSIQNIIPPEYDIDEWDYTHIPLPEQFDTYGMRSIELDIYHDPDGGRFYYRKGLAFIGEDTASYEPELLDPGFKVLHIPDMDYNTHYLSLHSALTEVKTWSDAHPDHLPLYVMIELKTQTIADAIPTSSFVKALPYTPGAMDSLDQEIYDVFGAGLEKVITPDDLRGSYGSVEEAALAGAWPSVSDARGKLFFIAMMGTDEQNVYLSGHPGLQGRPMFFFSEPGNPEAAFLKYDDPMPNLAEIQARVAEGYMIRTRADAGTVESRTGDYSRMNAAFSSGAQIISTDYYKASDLYPQTTGWTDYHAEVPNGTEVTSSPVNGETETPLCPE